MLTTPEKLVFAALIIATAAAFSVPIIRRIRIVLAGAPEDRFRGLWKRLVHAVTKVLFQRCTVREERLATGLLHAGLFYGALTFDTMTVSHTLEGFFDGFYLFGRTGLGLVFSFAIDVAAFTVMAAVIFLAFRRFVVRPKAYATTKADSAAIYVLITLATATYLYFEAFAVAHHPETARWSFLGPWLAGFIGGAGLSPEAIASNFKIAWWAHVVAVYGFIAYVPHSKYLHMFVGPFNVLFRRSAPSGELAALDLERSEVFGVEKLPDLTWKDDLDAFACMECGRCQDACPAFASEKPLSPKMIVFNMERALLAGDKALVGKTRDALPELVPATFSEGEIWTCTTCGACQKECPVEIEHIRKIVGARRSQVLMQSKFPQELNAFFRNMETNANPWGIGFAKRAEWGEALGVPHIKDVPDAEVLFWVGCMGAYDDGAKGIASSFVRILRAAGVNFGTLGTEEKCCGDSARRLGHEYLFQSLAQENIALFKRYGVRKILTICPHGFNTLKNEYPKLLGLVPDLGEADKADLAAIEVVSHVELVARLIGEKRIALKPSAAGIYTFHDPCYLGRHNGLTKEPRSALAAALGGKPKELARHGDASFCCGAGGGLMWTEESLGTRINHLRTDEVIASGAPLAAAACPFCLTMLRDGLKDKAREDVAVKDVAELVAERL
ncbi:MAG TPA: heterodisulfide reductase-related iron-sulfur binding cluster [Acidobacteriota bacterium]|nr:heterodisulfide reductase-related iron-sulfur binding cluster [Acidobacteriota bacterium]